MCMARLAEAGIDVDANDTRIARLLRRRQAAANFWAMPMTARKLRSSCWRGARWGRCRTISTVESFRVMVERRHNAIGELVTVSEGGGAS